MTSTNALYVPDVSGLWAHSHNEETDLMKQFVLEVKLPTGGWLATKSFSSIEAAGIAVYQLEEGTTFRVFDQFAQRVAA